MKRAPKVLCLAALLVAAPIVWRAIRAPRSDAPYKVLWVSQTRDSKSRAAKSRYAIALDPIAAKIVSGARAQIGTTYTQDYFSIPYPNGDVPADRGACTDVVIRALRHVGTDLQSLIHRDMKNRWAAYPKKWGLKRTDRNIDHRRVPNQICFLKKHAQSLPRAVTQSTLKSWRAGDIVYWKFSNGLDHCGIVSDRRNARGVPLVIHNLGGCREEDVLKAWTITGHFRFPRRNARIAA